MPKDQVRISFGPARYDSPKAIRKQIEDSKQETQESTIQEIVNSTTLDLGGGAAIPNVEVTAYDPVTGIGTGTAAGTSYTFTNGTGVFLTAGDIVVLVESDGDYYAVGVTERSGEVTPVDQPIAVLPTGFPLIVGNQVFPIRPDYSTSVANAQCNVTYDMAGVFGIGSDAIIGPNSAAAPTAVNAFIRSTPANVSLFPPASGSLGGRYYMQPNGRVVTLDYQNGGLAYRLPGAGSWTTTSLGTTKWAIDYETGAMWGANNSTGTPAVHTIYRFLPTDAAPVNMGTLGTPNSNSTGNAPWIAAGHGYVTMSVQTATGIRTYCVKPSMDSTNFTQMGTFATSSWTPTTDQVFRLQVDQNGATSYLAIVSSTLRIRSLTQTLVVFDYDTGIIPISSYGYNHKHLSSGVVALICGVRQDYLGGASTTLYSPTLSTYNYSTTSYQYFDLAIAGSSGTLATFGGIDEISAGTIRFTISDTNPVNTRVVELSGL